MTNHTHDVSELLHDFFELAIGISLAHGWEPVDVFIADFVVDVKLEASIVGGIFFLENIEVVKIVPEQMFADVFVESSTIFLHLNRIKYTSGLLMWQM